jgi:flavin reductase (DIM6/NTAB) family NADH-FMN oxidoreductase RutF
MSSPASNDAPGYDRLEMDGLTRQERYKLLTGSVIPRPIAFVTTLNQDGGINAAPFSQFIIIAADCSASRLAPDRRDAPRTRW